MEHDIAGSRRVNSRVIGPIKQRLPTRQGGVSELSLGLKAAMGPLNGPRTLPTLHRTVN